jgi:hypothetical protein
LTVAGCCYPSIFRPSATIGFNVWANSTRIDWRNIPITLIEGLPSPCVGSMSAIAC